MIDRPGSIIADYTINAANSNLDLSSANTQVSDTLLKAGIRVAQDAFEESGKSIAGIPAYTFVLNVQYVCYSF